MDGYYSEQLGTQPVVRRCVRSSVIGTKSRHLQNLLQRTLFQREVQASVKIVSRCFVLSKKNLFPEKKFYGSIIFVSLKTFFPANDFFLWQKKPFILFFRGLEKIFCFKRILLFKFLNRCPDDGTAKNFKIAKHG